MPIKTLFFSITILLHFVGCKTIKKAECDRVIIDWLNRSGLTEKEGCPTVTLSPDTAYLIIVFEKAENNNLDELIIYNETEEMSGFAKCLKSSLLANYESHCIINTKNFFQLQIIKEESKIIGEKSLNISILDELRKKKYFQYPDVTLNVGRGD